MSDNFRFSEDDVLTVHNSLVTKNEEFKALIDKLTNLIKEIESSNSWQDAEVKTAFINSINTYVSFYNSAYTKLTSYADYLNKKTNSISQFESNYSKG